jgi:hypothetical protein
MLIVEMIAKIRRAFFVQGKPIKAICRELRISRKVVRKVLRSEATAFRYERETQPLPKIGPWRDKLDQLLLANEGKASRQRLTLIRLFEEHLAQNGTPNQPSMRSVMRSELLSMTFRHKNASTIFAMPDIGLPNRDAL